MNVNVYLIEENVKHINVGIMMNDDESVKNIIYAKKILLGIPLHAILKLVIT